MAAAGAAGRKRLAQRRQAGVAPERQRPVARRAVVQLVAEVEVAVAVAAIRLRVAADRPRAAGLVAAEGPGSTGPMMAARAGGV